MRDIIAIMDSGHTFKQKLNYLKCRFYPKREKLSYYPMTISIVATGRCTLSCDMCPTHSAAVPKDYPHIQKNARDIDFDMFKEIVDRFSDALAVHIIGSGEPLLNKDFFRMVDYAAAKRMAVKTFSNGTTVRDNIDRILNSKLEGLTISINGHDAGEFKRMTGMGESVYSDICSAVKELVGEKKRRGSRVKIKLSFIIDRYNYRSIPEMIALALRLDVDHTFLCNFLPSPYKGLSAEERILEADDKVMDEMRAVMQSYPPQIRRKVTFPVLVDKMSRRNICDVHFSQIRFDGDGNVSSCSMMLLNMSGHGNYKDYGVWNNEFFRNMRKAFLSGDEGAIEDPCKVCPDNKGVRIV